jgi:triacylglycerol lipase
VLKISLVKESIFMCQVSYQDHIPCIYDRSFDVQGIWLEEGDSLIIAFRGSTSLQDWINNFRFNKLEYPWATGNSAKIRLHAGFTDAYKSIRPQVHNLVKRYQRTHQINFTGHSQGGAIALIAALDCQYNFAIAPSLVTFGQPKVGNLAFCESVDRRLNNYFRFVNHCDPVPLVPKAKEQYRHAGQEVKYFSFALNPHHINTYQKAIANAKSN